MANDATITQEYLKSILDYNPITGEFRHKTRGNAPWDARWAGKLAGTLDGRGRGQLWINKKSYRAHRIAWLYMVGEFPDKEIDHINCNQLDNRWANLRLATRSQQNQNKRPVKMWPPKGVRLNVKTDKWQARLNDTHLGVFDCPAAASIAYQIAAISAYGEFERSF